MSEAEGDAPVPAMSSVRVGAVIGAGVSGQWAVGAALLRLLGLARLWKFEFTVSALIKKAPKMLELLKMKLGYCCGTGCT